MLQILGATDLNDLFLKAMKEMMDDKSHWDIKQTPRLLSYNNTLTSNSLNFTFDLSTVGFTKTRWARYCHQYLDNDQLHLWLESLHGITEHGEDLFRSKDMIRRPREHRHGSCWIGLSYRENPPTLVLYSRVAEFPTRAALELTMVNKVGQEISSITGHPLSEIHLTWFVSSLYLSCLHILPWLQNDHRLEEVYARQDEVGKFVAHQLDHIAKGNVKYGPTKRMGKRVEQMKNGTIVKVPIENLSLWLLPMIPVGLAGKD